MFADEDGCFAVVPAVVDDVEDDEEAWTEDGLRWRGWFGGEEVGEALSSGIVLGGSRERGERVEREVTNL